MYDIERGGSSVQRGPAESRNVDTVNAELLAAAEKENLGHFNARTVISPPYHHDEVRFTTRDGHLFVCVLNPAPGPLKIPALGAGSSTPPGAIRSATLLADGSPVVFQQTADALRLDLPAGITSGLPLVVALEGPAMASH